MSLEQRGDLPYALWDKMEDQHQSIFTANQVPDRKTEK